MENAALTNGAIGGRPKQFLHALVQLQRPQERNENNVFVCTFLFFTLLFTQNPQTNLLINSEHLQNSRDPSKISQICTQHFVLEAGILTEGYLGFIFLVAD